MLALCQIVCLTVLLATGQAQSPAAELWPDGSRIEKWFSQGTDVATSPRGRAFDICRYGAVPGSDSTLQTAAIQKAIDAAFKAGGGTVVIPEGTFLSGALFFRKGTRLFMAEGAVLKGSDDIEDYPYADVHIEGRRQQYIAALVNAYGVDGFSISGRGTIDGNGLKFWKAFWARRAENPECTNLEVLRPRLIYVANSRNVTIRDVRLRNPGFWTTHLYKCERVRICGVDIKAPTGGVNGLTGKVNAPSSDGIDLDACTMVHIKDCSISVNDDFVALKGGKGPYAPTNPDNGPDSRILIENCRFGAGPHVLTFGSECYDASNVILRNSKVSGTSIVLRLKIRPDTPQSYRHILLENVSGTAGKLVHIRPWTQFFDPGDRKDIPVSVVEDVTVKGCKFKAGKILDVKADSAVVRLEAVKMIDNQLFEINYSEKKVAPYTLPDPLVFVDGTPVGDTLAWPRRREEILGLFQSQMYGRMPAPMPVYCETVGERKTCAGFATRRDVRMTFAPDHSGPAIDWMVVTPRDVKGPYPVILMLNFDGNDSLPSSPEGHYIFPIAEMVARGYAFVTAGYEDVVPDPDDTTLQKTLPYTRVMSLWPAVRDTVRADNTGAIAAWAWALSRGMDMILDDGRLDADRVIVTGCSRLGKAALLAGAFDTRFSVVAPIQTGGGGAPLSKRNFGETVQSETSCFTHWFCRAFRRYACNEAAMPFDQHMLLACVAPRALLVLGFDNPWFDTYGEFLSLKAASPAWDLYGLPGLPAVDWPADYDISAIGPCVGYARRKRAHGISGYEWKWIMDFAERYWSGSGR